MLRSWLGRLARGLVLVTPLGCGGAAPSANADRVGAVPPPSRPTRVVEEVPSERTSSGAEPPLTAEAPAGFELRALPVPGFLDAVVALPRAPEPKPLIVATHGAGGAPEWTCHAWAERVAAEYVVLCPRGRAISVKDDYGYYYPDHRALGAEVFAALEACRQQHAARLAPGPALYTAYSQGASMGSLALADHGAEFPRLVLTEGGFNEWSTQSARRFAKSGGRRVLFVCGGRGCRDRAEKSARWLRDAGVAARVEYVPGGGHTDGGAVGARLDSVYAWVLGDDGSTGTSETERAP